MFDTFIGRRIPEHRNPLFVTATLFLFAVWFVALQRSQAFQPGVRAFTIGLTVAAVPLVLYVPLGLLVDRYEKEPKWMLAAAFIWGATVAVFLASLLNPLVGGASTLARGAGLGTVLRLASVKGAVVEEIVKGAVLFLLFFWQRDEFDNTVDGIVYATMVGLGFAMTENVHRYAEAWAGASGLSLREMVMGRGVLSPFSHPLFTAMMGIGLGWAREKESRWVKGLAPLVGLVVAILLHMGWNGSIAAGKFLPAYVGVMVPTFLLMVFVVTREQSRERLIIRKHLSPYVGRGLLGEDEVEMLCRFGGRLEALYIALKLDCIRGLRCEAIFHQAATELAFHRWRIKRGITRGTVQDDAREREYLRLIAEHRTRRALVVSG